jgi:hypothetical protein
MRTQEEMAQTRDMMEGVFKVVEIEDLESVTLSGWKFVKLIPVQSVQSGTREEVKPPREGYNNHYDENHRLDVPFVVNGYKALVMEDEACAVAVATARASRAEADVFRLRNDVLVYEAELADLTKVVEAANDAEKDARERADRNQRHMLDVRESMRSMEADLAKARDEIGAARWRELTGDEG